jgi:hypothetical protein
MLPARDQRRTLPIRLALSGQHFSSPCRSAPRDHEHHRPFGIDLPIRFDEV